MAGIDLGDAWADNVWESGVWADGVWAGQESSGGGGPTPPSYGADTVPASRHSTRWWVPFCIALLLLAGCTEITVYEPNDCVHVTIDLEAGTATVDTIPADSVKHHRPCLEAFLDSVDAMEGRR